MTRKSGLNAAQRAGRRQTSFAAHRHVALILCDNPAVLEELLLEVELDEDITIERIGGRALALPIDQLETVRQQLFARGVFPRVVGAPVHHEP